MSETETAEVQSWELQDKAEAIINRRTIYAAGAGLIPVPGIDIATLLGVQVIMIRDLAEVYGLRSQFRRNKIKHFIQVLIGDLGTVGVMSGVKAIPLVGPIVGMLGVPLTGAAATYALGRVFATHFDQGGTLLDFDPDTSRDYFKEEFEKGKTVVADIKKESQD